jgi:putative YhdH/YhfP family quinone oxidoreductase
MDDTKFLALVTSEDEEHRFRRSITKRTVKELPPGEVLIRVRFSSLNYKDALSASGNRGVTKHYPHTPGIDAAGQVIFSTNHRWRAGDEVICTGYDLGMNTDGGFGQYVRVPADWVVRKPDTLTLLESMQLGTAGFTAALSVLALEQNGISADKGPILVTGATGGVGSIAVLLLHRLGYEVVALTGKAEAKEFLLELGAHTILDRQALLADKERPLLPARWAGVIDTVGGDILATAIKGTGFDGVVTSCGNAASGELPLNVYPFILRGVHLQGIYAANCPMERRLRVWERLATAWKLSELERLCRMITLQDLEQEIGAMLAGKSKGRCVVDLGEEL